MAALLALVSVMTTSYLSLTVFEEPVVLGGGGRKGEIMNCTWLHGQVAGAALVCATKEDNAIPYLSTSGWEELLRQQITCPLLLSGACITKQLNCLFRKTQIAKANLILFFSFVPKS